MRLLKKHIYQSPHNNRFKLHFLSFPEIFFLNENIIILIPLIQAMKDYLLLKIRPQNHTSLVITRFHTNPRICKAPRKHASHVGLHRGGDTSA